MKNHLNSFTRFLLKLEHRLLSFAMHFIPFKRTKLLSSYNDIASTFKARNINKVMIITGRSIIKFDMHKELMEAFNKQNIIFLIYSDFSNDPTTKEIDYASIVYKESKAQALVSFGGGSIIDAAKGVGIQVSNKGGLKKHKGIFKVKKKLPFHIAIPTTCGTGSETTWATVIKDSNSNDKFTIVSNKITPDYAFLNKFNLKTLPKNIYGYSAMDALTHAIESYLNICSTRKSRKDALLAVKTIKNNILLGLNLDSKPTDYEPYNKMLIASYLAGRSFNRGMVGNIHSLSHGIASYYNIPHGKINAILLPEMLKEYLKSNYCIRKINEIAKAMDLATLPDKIHNGLNLIDWILTMNAKFDIPMVIKELKVEDFDAISDHAYQEAAKIYCTPLIFDIEDYKEILYLVKPNNND